MNFHEIKCFSSTEKSREYLKANPEGFCPFDLYDIIPSMLDFDRIIAFRPHQTEKCVSIIEVQGSNEDFIVPMEYENFKTFFLKKMKVYFKTV